MCLRGLLSLPSRHQREIIVVDNASADGTPEMVRQEFPSARCLALPKNIGFGPGNNAGLQASIGKYILIMNPDIVILDDALDRLIDFMETHPEVGLVGPQLRNPDGSIQFSCYHFPTPLIPLYRRTPLGHWAVGQKALAHYLMTDWDHQTIREVDWLLGAFLVARRSMIDQLGSFDERFFLYFEDADLCRRAWQSGWRVVYNPEMQVVHYHRRESAGSIFSLLTNWIAREHLKSGLKYFLKYWGQPQPR